MSKRLFQFQNQIVDSRGDDRIQAGGGLVEKENFRVHGERPRNGGAFFHSAAQLRRHVVFKTGEANLFEFQPHHDFDRRIIEWGVLAQGERDIFSHGHRPEQRAALKRHPHFLAQFVALGLPASQRSFSRASRFRRELGRSSPTSVRKRVLFPEPEPPRITSVSPAWTSKLMPCKISRSPY